MLKHIGLVVGAVAVLLVAATHVIAARPAVPTTIDIKEFKFGPPEVTVAVGNRVTWTNRDEETHTVTSATGAFSSTGLSHDDTFTQTFTRPGRYAYFCALHPQMRATVVVR
jgi:plastocyanin